MKPDDEAQSSGHVTASADKSGATQTKPPLQLTNPCDSIMWPDLGPIELANDNFVYNFGNPGAIDQLDDFLAKYGPLLPEALTVHDPHQPPLQQLNVLDVVPLIIPLVQLRPTLQYLPSVQPTVITQSQLPSTAMGTIMSAQLTPSVSKSSWQLVQRLATGLDCN